MKGKFLKIAIAVAAAALCILAVACQGRGTDSGSETHADPANGWQASEQVSDVQVDTANEDWPGQAEGYVGPNGEGVLDSEDFETEEEYRNAAIDAAGKEVDVPSEVAKGDGFDYMRGKVWLDFKDGCGEKRAREIVSECGGQWVSSTYKWGSRSAETYFADAEDFGEVTAACERLMAYAEVEAAYPELINASGDLHFAVNDPLASGQDYLSAARFRQAWDAVRCKKTVSIALLDTGVYRLHEDLRDNILGGYDAYNSIRLNMSDCEDTYGHGTQTAGVACAAANNAKGVAGCSYNAVLKAIRITSSGNTIDAPAVKRGLEYLRDIDTPDVASMSFGLGAIENSLPSSIILRSQIQGVLDDLHDADVVLIASVGNDSNSTEHYPAKFDYVIGVGSVESDLTHTPVSNSNDTVDICAYGSGVRTTGNPAYGIHSDYVDGASGTSYAAPQVAAAAALLKAQDASRSAEDIEDLLFANTVKPGDFTDEAGGGSSGDEPDGKDDDGRYGYGALDAAAAVGWTAPSGSGTGSGGGSSPFTGPGGDFSLSELQVAAQQRIQATRPDGIPDALARAMKANPDVCAWLYVPGTDVSAPVAWREGDGSYYLHHDSFGNESSIGCAYARQGAGGLSGAVTVLYGHSFSAGSLAFTSLHAFEDAAFFAGHEEAYVYLPGRRLEYRVVGANLFNARAIEDVDQADAADLADYFAELSSPEPASFVGFKRRGSLDAGHDRVLQLSTCTVPADPARRFVVTCVYAGEEEL